MEEVNNSVPPTPQTSLPEELQSKFPETSSANNMPGNIFFNKDLFEHAARVANALAKSDLLPAPYKGNVANCLIALEMSHRLDVSPWTLMQHSAIVNGKPCIEGKFTIALLNTRSGFLDPLDWKYEGEGDALTCTCFTRKADGVLIEEKLSVKEVKACGWWDKNQSWWPKLTRQMLAYRTATLLARKYCPQVILGLATIEEEIDIGEGVTVVTSPSQRLSKKLKGVKTNE